MKYFILCFLFPLNALACPDFTLAGFDHISQQKGQVYADKAKTVTLVVSCKERVDQKIVTEALGLLGKVQALNQKISYVEMKKGAMRIYATNSPTFVQVSLVAKSPGALERAEAKIIKMLE
ncbi:MAG: hypothetical protein COT73_05815 [Bdellovibrio sp. CG10_big_fil_rev_8_21_14_0_10_47_8]|nr:MAG: hypothetical protein COT73_05815 [Bdellovibrio sp. CG10_big_fil_rev_8_21_14_0_10_47_8]